MSEPPRPIRFFAVALKPSRSLRVALLALVAFALWIAWTEPTEVEQTLVLALVFQMFAAANGYQERAVRGHFDPILAVGRSRPSIAAAHWALSIAPGVVAWLLLTAIVFLVRPSEWPASFTASGLAAFAYVSCLAWALALPLTRYASGVVWIMVLFLLAGGRQLDALREAYAMAGSGWTHVLARAGAAMVCPIFLLANPNAAGSIALLLVLLVAALCTIGGAFFIATLDIPLRDPT